MVRSKGRNLLLLVVLVAVMLTVGACVKHRVAEGILRDTLFSVEETRNGYWRIFMTHDDVAGYCTGDEALGKKARNLLQEHHGEVIVKFRSISEGDPEYSLWSKSDCGSVSTGAETSMAMFLLEDIYGVPPR